MAKAKTPEEILEAAQALNIKAEETLARAQEVDAEAERKIAAAQKDMREEFEGEERRLNADRAAFERMVDRVEGGGSPEALTAADAPTIGGACWRPGEDGGPMVFDGGRKFDPDHPCEIHTAGSHTTHYERDKKGAITGSSIRPTARPAERR